jgi:hypothetical protein
MAHLPSSDTIGGELLSQADLVDDAGPQLNFAGVDEEWLLGALFRDLERGEHAKAVLVEAEMRRIAELNQQLEHRCIDGLGQLAARIPLDMYLYWQAREGEGFWREQSNLEYFGARNPGFLIKTKMKPTIVVGDKPFPTRVQSDITTGEKPAGGANPPAKPPARPRARRGRWAL